MAKNKRTRSVTDISVKRIRPNHPEEGAYLRPSKAPRKSEPTVDTATAAANVKPMEDRLLALERGFQERKELAEYKHENEIQRFHQERTALNQKKMPKLIKDKKIKDLDKRVAQEDKAFKDNIKALNDEKQTEKNLRDEQNQKQKDMEAEVKAFKEKQKQDEVRDTHRRVFLHADSLDRFMKYLKTPEASVSQIDGSPERYLDRFGPNTTLDSSRRIISKIDQYIREYQPDMVLPVCLFLGQSPFFSIEEVDYPDDYSAPVASKSIYGRHDKFKFLPQERTEDWGARLPTMFENADLEVLEKLASLYANIPKSNPNMSEQESHKITEHILDHLTDILTILKNRPIYGKNKRPIESEVNKTNNLIPDYSIFDGALRCLIVESKKFPILKKGLTKEELEKAFNEELNPVLAQLMNASIEGDCGCAILADWASYIVIWIDIDEFERNKAEYGKQRPLTIPFHYTRIGIKDIKPSLLQVLFYVIDTAIENGERVSRKMANSELKKRYMKLRGPLTQGTGDKGPEDPASGAQPSGAQGPGAQPSGAQPSGAQPSGAQPSGDQGPGAQPSGAQPSGAQPSGAQPSGAQPSGAQPSGAQPSGDQGPGDQAAGAPDHGYTANRSWNVLSSPRQVTHKDHSTFTDPVIPSGVGFSPPGSASNPPSAASGDTKGPIVVAPSSASGANNPIVDISLDRSQIDILAEKDCFFFVFSTKAKNLDAVIGQNFHPEEEIVGKIFGAEACQAFWEENVMDFDETLVDTHYQNEKKSKEILIDDPNFNCYYINHKECHITITNYHQQPKKVSGKCIFSRYIDSNSEIDDEAYEQAESQLKIIHGHNITHGDMNARNILCNNGKVYIIDFELARFSPGYFYYDKDKCALRRGFNKPLTRPGEPKRPSEAELVRMS